MQEKVNGDARMGSFCWFAVGGAGMGAGERKRHLQKRDLSRIMGETVELRGEYTNEIHLMECKRITSLSQKRLFRFFSG